MVMLMSNEKNKWYQGSLVTHTETTIIENSSQTFTLVLVIHICVIRVSRVIAGRLGALLIVEKEDSE